MNGKASVARRQPPHCQSGRSPAPWMTTTTGRLPVAPVGREIHASGCPATGSASKNLGSGARAGGAPASEIGTGSGALESGARADPDTVAIATAEAGIIGTSRGGGAGSLRPARSVAVARLHAKGWRFIQLGRIRWGRRSRDDGQDGLRLAVEALRSRAAIARAEATRVALASDAVQERRLGHVDEVRPPESGRQRRRRRHLPLVGIRWGEAERIARRDRRAHSEDEIAQGRVARGLEPALDARLGAAGDPRAP